MAKSTRRASESKPKATPATATPVPAAAAAPAPAPKAPKVAPAPTRFCTWVAEAGGACGEPCVGTELGYAPYCLDHMRGIGWVPPGERPPEPPPAAPSAEAPKAPLPAPRTCLWKAPGASEYDVSCGEPCEAVYNAKRELMGYKPYCAAHQAEAARTVAPSPSDG